MGVTLALPVNRNNSIKLFASTGVQTITGSDFKLVGILGSTAGAVGCNSRNAEVELFFDGRTVSVFGRSINGYAQFDAPGTVDRLIDALRAGHGIALPGADLLLSNSYDALTIGVLESKHIGRGVIDGVVCEHLTFRNFDTDWQLW